jgi:glucan endo-1,3-alpha-glucosidase
MSTPSRFVSSPRRLRLRPHNPSLRVSRRALLKVLHMGVPSTVKSVGVGRLSLVDLPRLLLVIVRCPARAIVSYMCDYYPTFCCIIVDLANDFCGGGNRLSLFAATTTTTTATSTSTPTSVSAGGKTWSYTACYVDSVSSRVLPTIVSSSSSQSVASCLASCAAQGFAYGGTEYGKECWCGSSITGGSPVASTSDCSMRCTGNCKLYLWLCNASEAHLICHLAADICGGGNRLSLYTASAGASFSYVGCVAEGTTGSRRSLTGASYSQSNMTPSVCQSLCGGYRYAGVEFR